MPVNLDQPGVLYPVAGIRVASGQAGIRYKNRDDLVIFELAQGSRCVGVFTRNAFCAAPVTVAREHIANTAVRYLLINSGNANAGTGAQGLINARQSCAAVAAIGDVSEQAVLPFSTGVIGQPLPVERIVAALPAVFAGLEEDAWLQTARAIMTTDTQPKAYSARFELDGKTITITGIAKGSGMICPNMATMLGYVATDADIEARLLQQLLHETSDKSFNSITVDGDTSTNDACILMATGKSGVKIESGLALQRFRNELQAIMILLAQAIIRDGEGATKFVAICVAHARSVQEAKDVGYTVAHSPLVKTALSASDANWGRILAAVGRAPVDDFDLSKVNISVGVACIVENGEPAAGYSEAIGAAEFAKEEITIRIDLRRGDAEATIWTTDLSHEYVTINADYRS